MIVAIIQGMSSRQSLPMLERHSAYPLALRVIERLQEQGQGVLAGGCVRDSLLGLVPKDLDIATSLKPDQVEALFKHTLAVGKEFGTIIVVEDGHQIEVTTFRRDGPYVDGRRPSRVDFSDMREDAWRRDFTVNALFYDPVSMELLDFVDGVSDLKAKHLRTVGLAADRFGEDRLRMLRAVRFIAQLGFTLDDEALGAIQKLHPQLASVSAERILNEVRRMLEGSYLHQGLLTLQRSGLAHSFWPEVQAIDIDALGAFGPFLNWEHAFSAIMLLSHAHDVEPRLRFWKASRESLRRVQGQMQGCKTLTDIKSHRADRVRVLGGEVFAESLSLASGVLRLQGQDDRSAEWLKEFMTVSTKTGELPKAWLTGADLKERGIEPGALMGELLKRIYDEQLEGKLPSRASALRRLDELKDSQTLKS